LSDSETPTATLTVAGFTTTGPAVGVGIGVGVAVGIAEDVALGAAVGEIVGIGEGVALGDTVGLGDTLGIGLGEADTGIQPACTGVTFGCDHALSAYQYWYMPPMPFANAGGCVLASVGGTEANVSVSPLLLVDAGPIVAQ